MSDTGKYLEVLIKQIEKFLLPETFQVTGNERVFNDDGIQIAEFDIEIRGRLGSTDIAWLIECRDRPSHGPAPGSWIEQLVGRRQRFGFNKVTAVSTTGFAPGAVEYATEAGIELRIVKKLTAEDIKNWCLMEHMTVFKQGGRIEQAKLIRATDEPEEIKKAFEKAVLGKRIDEPILRSTETGKLLSIVNVANKVISENSYLYDDVEPDGVSKKVHIRATYPDDASHLVVETEAGDVRVTDILLELALAVKTEHFPIDRITRYAHNDGDEPIAESVSLNFDVNDKQLSLELHKLAETGETHVLVRKLEK